LLVKVSKADTDLIITVEFASACYLIMVSLQSNLEEDFWYILKWA